VDVNIGTNYNPFAAQAGRFRILVDPLFDVCEKVSTLGVQGQTVLCIAVSDFTGFTSFKEYNGDGVSSSLSEVAKGTSHGTFEVISKRTVLVLEAQILFRAIFDRGTTIRRLKLDLQGNELKVLRNIKAFLQHKKIHHIMAECFCPIDGRQIYMIDNDCEKIAAVLQDSGFVAKYDCTPPSEVSDVIAYKPPANDFWTIWD
jgi:FkbM family methyltransferase